MFTYGTEWFDLYNPATARVIGQVRLADEVDAGRAVTALKRMHAAVVARYDDLLEAIVEEYGAPASRSAWMARYQAESDCQAIEALGGV